MRVALPVSTRHHFAEDPKLPPMTIARVLMNALTARPYKVEGDSMLPALATGQYVLLTPSGNRRNPLSRGDIVVVRHPLRNDDVYIKRIVGLPDEDIRLEDGLVYLNGNRLEEAYPIVLPKEGEGGLGEWWTGPDEYFVLGDNRSESKNIWAFGPVNSKLVLGRVWFRYWPLRAWGPLANA
jgi:signal peptidase I